MPLNSDTQIDESAVLPSVASTRSKKSAAGREPRVLAGKTRIAKPALRASKTAVTKSDAVLKLLRAARGASIDDLTNATGWQAHSVRGFLSGTVKKKLGLELSSENGKDGVRRYRVANASKPS